MDVGEIEKARREIAVSAKERVRVLIEFVPDSDGAAASPNINLECRSCDTEFVWVGDEGWYKCRLCGMELTPKELFSFLGDCVDTLNSVIKPEELVTDGAASAEGNVGQWTRDQTRELLKRVGSEAVMKGGEVLQRLLTRFRR